MSAQPDMAAGLERGGPPKVLAAEPRHAVPGRGGRTLQVLALLLGLIIALSLAAQAVLAWRNEQQRLLSVGPPGALYSVHLLNGQMYFGNLLEVRPGFIKLGDVYYIQSFTPPNGQPGNRVVSRQKNDWHGPAWQAIPSDKILMIEAVGPQSQLARLIQQDKGVPAVD